MMKTNLELNDQTLKLFRFPKRDNETLQAWDAGDEYLINYVEELGIAPNSNILILNDSFGALSCWFSAKHNVTLLSDSFIATQGARNNLALNQCNDVTLGSTIDELPEKIDLVLMQIPRSNRHLVYLLNKLRLKLDETTQVIAVNKAKDIHTSTLKLFEKYLGTTTTSLAWKKHRLVFSKADSEQTERVNPITRWEVEKHGYWLDNLPNVYSGESLDLGARFMLEHLPKNPNLVHAVDLGCGNGVLSVKLGQLNPELKLTAIDESFMAVESSRRNLLANLGANRDFRCMANNCLDNIVADDVDLIVCNPPFHQQQAITDHIAWQMFCDAKQILNSSGQLLVIGNRHLGYDGKLARLFGKSNVKLVASNKKFVILQATK